MPSVVVLVLRVRAGDCTSTGLCEHLHPLTGLKGSVREPDRSANSTAPMHTGQLAAPARVAYVGSQFGRRQWDSVPRS